MFSLLFVFILTSGDQLSQLSHSDLNLVCCSGERRKLISCDWNLESGKFINQLTVGTFQPKGKQREKNYAQRSEVKISITKNR